MAIGNIGTGKGSVVLLNEEYSYGTLGTTNAVWVRRLSHGFDRNPLFVETGHAASVGMGQVKETVHDATGSLDCELDATSAGWLFKWITACTLSATQQGGTSEYKHVFRFGSTPKTIQASVNDGGLSTPYYEKYQGLFLSNLSLNLDMAGTIRAGLDFIGQTSATTTTPGTPSVAADNLTFAFGDVSYAVGTAGETTFAGMTSWTDPFDFEINFLRVGADNKNYNSDGTGKPTGVYEGQGAVNVKLAAQLTTNHKIATFLNGTEVSFGIQLDTGVAIPSGNGSNYLINVIFPRVRFEKYQRRASGPGTIIAVIPIRVMKDATAGYEVSVEIYNNTASYPNSTA